MQLHQRLYAAEILLAEKQQDVISCYQRMADGAKQVKALDAQLSKLRLQHTSALKEVQVSKRYCTSVEEENVVLKRQVRQQTDVVKGLESSLVSMRQQLESAHARGKALDDAVKESQGALDEARASGQVIAQSLGRDVDCLLSVACRLQSEYLAVQKLAAEYETKLVELRTANSGEQGTPTSSLANVVCKDGRSGPDDCATHPLGSGFNDPALLDDASNVDKEVGGNRKQEKNAGGTVTQSATPNGASVLAATEVVSVDTGEGNEGQEVSVERAAGKNVEQIKAALGDTGSRSVTSTSAVDQGQGGVSAEDFKRFRADKHNRQVAIAAKAAASTSKGALASRAVPLKNLVKTALLGQTALTLESPGSSSRDNRKQDREKRGAKRWGESELSDLYQNWRHLRGLEMLDDSQDTANRDSVGMCVHAASSGGGVSGDMLKEGETLLWRGDGGVLGVPNVLDVSLDSEIASLSSQDLQASVSLPCCLCFCHLESLMQSPCLFFKQFTRVRPQDLLVDTALRVARTRRGCNVQGHEENCRASPCGATDGHGSSFASISPTSMSTHEAAGNKGFDDVRSCSGSRTDRGSSSAGERRSRDAGLAWQDGGSPQGEAGVQGDFADWRTSSNHSSNLNESSDSFNDPIPLSPGQAGSATALTPRGPSAGQRQGSLGLELQEDPKTGCFLVSRVRQGGNAHETKIEVGDVLLEVDGHQVISGWDEQAGNGYEAAAMTLQRLVQLCRGPVGSVARVKVLKGNGRWRFVHAWIPRS